VSQLVQLRQKQAASRQGSQFRPQCDKPPAIKSAFTK
jgi:hypothetical protein